MDTIPGKQTINIGLPNESANSDSLYTAFSKANTNFNILFACASPFNTFNSGDGIEVNANSSTGTVTVTNTGVTNIIAGTNITIDHANGNVTISANGGGGGGGGTVTSVGLVPASTNRLTVAGSPIVSSGTMVVDLATSGVISGTYANPNITIDEYGRITSASNGSIAGTVTSVGLTPGPGVQINGGPITSNGNITVTNTGVLRLNAGSGIQLSSGNGNVTISANTSAGTVTAVSVTSNQLVVTGSPIVTAGVIGINLPNSATFSGNLVANNVNANRINANGGNINGNLIITGNISPAAVNKVGGIKPGPGVDISLDGELTIDTANLPLSFGNFTADNNVLSIVNVDEDMILETQGNAEIQMVGNIGFYKPNVIPPVIQDRYFFASDDGQIQILVSNVDPTAGAVAIIGSTTGTYSPPVNTGVMLHLTGQSNIPSRFYNDGIGSFAAFVGRRINGSVDTPTPVQAGDELIRISSTGYNGTEVSGSGSARIVFQAMENFTISNAGSNLSFWATAIGSNVLTKIATIDNANGLVATKLVSTGNANVGNLGTSGSIAATGNVSGGNLTTGGVVSATGNVSGGNLVTTGSANVTGNVNAGNLVLATGNIIYTPRYGSFYSNVDQTNPVANTAMAMTFNNTTTANGVSVVANTQLTVAKAGVYNIQFSAQLTKTDAGSDYIEIWVAKNGNAVPWTNTLFKLEGSNTYQLATLNFVESLGASEYVELMWGSADTNAKLVAIPSANTTMGIDVPSVIVTVVPVGA